MIICIKWVKNQTDCHSKLLRLINNKVKRKYGIVSIGSWTFENNSSVTIESNRFSKWQAHAYHRKVWVPPLSPPRSPAFIDTLSSCPRDRIQDSYLSSLFFFFFFFFFLLIFCLFFQNQMQFVCFLLFVFLFVFFVLFFVVVFFFIYLFIYLFLLYLEPIFGMVGAKHTQTADTHDRFSKSL